MSDTPDVVAIFAVLHAATVDYVVIGGVAVQAYGRRTYTKDLDVTASWQRPNLERLAAALTALEASLRGVDGDRLGIDVSDPDQLSRAGSLALQTRAGDLDVLVDPDGAPPYLELRARAVEVELRGICVPICSREDLIAMKLAAGRRVDHDDIAVLTHPAQRTAEATSIHVERPTDWAEQLLGARPARGRRRQRLWDRAAQGIYLFHTEFGALPRRRPAREGPVGTSRTARLATRRRTCRRGARRAPTSRASRSGRGSGRRARPARRRSRP